MNVEMDHAQRLPYKVVLRTVSPAQAIPSLTVRLAQAILDLAECTEIDVANSVFVTRAISNDRLAVLAAGKPKAVARLIERFILRGLIETRRERFIIREPEKLRGIIAKAA